MVINLFYEFEIWVEQNNLQHLDSETAWQFFINGAKTNKNRAKRHKNGI